jgi:predicted AAA+ superfamily ATPase
MIDRMLSRDKISVVTDLVESFPAVAILGPRQVGKTTLAREISVQRPSVYLDLESEQDRSKLTDPAYYLSQHQDKLVILDEIHRVPELFQALRGLIDESRRAGRRAGQYLVLGSASIELLRQSGESLAGRIAYAELFPFNLAETGAETLEKLWGRGGFPDSFLTRSDRQSQTRRHNFIRTYLERDIPQFGPRVPAETLRRFWVMLAHLHGGLLNAASLARSLGVDNKTVSNYLDLLVDLLLVRRLPPWSGNVGKRLVKSPKIYIRDSGLLHTLLQIADFESLQGNPKYGDSWEGFVIENVLAVMPDDGEAFFYRTSAGAEIDLVLRFGAETWAIEIKRTTAPKLSKGFHMACGDIGPTRKFVVYGGKEHYLIPNDIVVLPLLDLMGLLRDVKA